MKKSGFIFLLFGILTFLFSVELPAQHGFESGYIVTLQHDTIKGTVKDRSTSGMENLYRKIKFYGPKGRRKKFGPDQIRAYAKGNQLFVSMWYETYQEKMVQRHFSTLGKGNQFFFRVIHSGYLSYYHLEYIDGEFDDIDFIPFYKRMDEPAMVRVTQGILGLKKKRLAEFFQDCPELLQKIENKELKDPIDIAIFYNQWYEENRFF
jgi:hypothetical protein